MNAENKRLLIFGVTMLVVMIVAVISLFTQNQILVQNNRNTAQQSVKKIERLTIHLAPLNNSGQLGKADLESIPGGKTKVTLSLNTATTSAQPAYIHFGSCENPVARGPLLVDLKDGFSESIIESSINELIATPSALIIHHSNNKLHTYNACGNIRTSQ